MPRHLLCGIRRLVTAPALAAVGVLVIVGCKPRVVIPASWAGLPDSVLAGRIADLEAASKRACPALQNPNPYFDASALSKFKPYMAHGSWDKRKLSHYKGGTVVTDGPIATAYVVEGGEKWDPTCFEQGWLPIAIVTVDANEPYYDKLSLYPGTNYWLVKKDVGVDTWHGYVQSVPVSGPISMLPVTLDPLPPTDEVPGPVFSARFEWNNDETLWSYCGGKCCSAKPLSMASR